MLLELLAFRHNLFPKVSTPEWSEELHRKKTIVKSGEVGSCGLSKFKRDFSKHLIIVQKKEFKHFPYDEIVEGDIFLLI